MPRDFPSASKSMLDLSGRTANNNSNDESNSLHRTRSVWDVGSNQGNTGRLRILSRPLSVVRPDRRNRNVSLPALSEEGRPPPRPRRISGIHWAESVRERRYESDDLTSQPSTSSSLSSPVTPAPPSSAGYAGSESDAFVSDNHLTEAQSMMSLARTYRNSNSSDDEPRGLRKKSASALHALKSLSRSTPAMSPSASPRHSDSEGQPRVSKGTKKFMRHFAEAPPNEWVLNYFACALVSDILLQGTLYITPNFFAFYSKIFGHVSRLLIPVTQVASIQKERTAKIIPNAVGLQMLDGKSYVFGSLLSRDSTYKLMLHIWKKAQRLADSDSEPPSAVQVTAEDDGDDSVSGSAESLMEDQTDSFLPSGDAPLPPIDTPPWPSDEPIANNTNSNNSSNNNNVNSDNCAASSQAFPSNNGITLNNVTTSGTAVLQRGGAKSGAPTSEEPGGTPASGEGEGIGLLQWFTQGSLVKTCFRMGSMPMKVVGEGVREVWSLPRTSLLLLISTLLLLLLFASAAFMLHRVDLLSQQLGLERYDEYDNMYEEVLQMQQRLHAAASTEVEKTLNIQLKHIATVRQSLEALMVLFNKEPQGMESAAQIPDNT
ncbi:hypothetical protein Pmani_022429 [Petrolisthes manimaculis]|uniref:GRAM domain-containing protein n=1 Tax=Petrolisthes manimaculis TaxID=1843537 RepID=A0AAE1PD06_9EUCA|nr:hypothetical protein Pmani_022429 [Petrolisthes manimaculis]